MDYQEAESPAFGGAAGSPSVASIQASLEGEVPVTLAVSSDTSVRVSNPNINFGTTPTLDINRGLVQVNQSALTGAVGPTDYVVSAVLRVSLVPDGTRRAQRNLDVHRVLKPWTENEATWNCAVDSNTGNRQPNCTGITAWKQTGIIDAFVPTATTRGTIPASRTGTLDLDVTLDVRAFLSGGASNFGWLLKTGQGNGSEVADLASRESSTPPQLVMTVRRCNAALCDDGNVCTVDSCTPNGACTNTQVPECVPVPPAVVVINEADSNSATSEPDFVELYNQGSSEADISGWSIRDNDDTHVFVVPAGTKIPVRGYVTFSETAGQLTFGLGSADSVRLFDAGATLKDTYSWTAHATTSYGRCPNGTGMFATTTAVTKGAANDCSPVTPPPTPADVVINEVESQPPTGEQDFIELHNKGTSVADVSGWSLRDNDDTHIFVIPQGTTIQPGGYLVYSELTGQLTFGLGSGDSARLFDNQTTLKDTYTWTAHATTTYGRCPNGTGNFATTTNATKGGANDCGSGPTFSLWPGAQTIAVADNPGTWSSNLSGLTYQPATASSPASLWAVQNSPSKLFRLEKSGSVWVNSSAPDWGAGKTLFYPNGAGMPDSEGVTKPEWDSPFVYVATERDNGVSGTSRLAILRFDTNAAGATLTATHEWNLTATLPVVGANLGLEAITHVPDAYLVQAGLRDQSTNQLYDPNLYPDHGTGLFFVGVEGTGLIYGFALNHTDSTFTRVVSFSSGMPSVMGLEFDRDQDTLYAYCDNTCGNRATLFAVQTDAQSPAFGGFFLGAAYNRPTALPADMNNESIAIAPESECTAGQKAVFWTDDGATGGNSLRVGSINCGSLF